MCCSTHRYNFIEKIEILTRDVVKHVIRTTCYDLRRYYNMIFKLVLCFLSSSIRSHNWLDENHKIANFEISYISIFGEIFFLPLKMEGQQKITLIFPLKISSVPKPFFRYFEENWYVHCTCTCTVYSCRTQMDL